MTSNDLENEGFGRESLSNKGQIKGERKATTTTQIPSSVLSMNTALGRLHGSIKRRTGFLL